jgi:hypothetical protein
MRNYVLTGIGLAALTAGCYHEEYAYRPPVASVRALTVATPPPAPVVETPSVQPYPGAVWTAGYWDWRPEGGRHVWVAGHWTRAPRPGLVWMPPRWQTDGAGRYYLIRGQWVVGASRDAYGRQVYYDAAGRPHYF